MELRTVLRCLPGRLLDGAAHARQGEAGGRALLVELLVRNALRAAESGLQAAWPRRDKEGAHVDDQELSGGEEQKEEQAETQAQEVG